jgi:hypothetical protein
MLRHSPQGCLTCAPSEHKFGRTASHGQRSFDRDAPSSDRPTEGGTRADRVAHPHAASRERGRCRRAAAPRNSPWPTGQHRPGGSMSVGPRSRQASLGRSKAGADGRVEQPMGRGNHEAFQRCMGNDLAEQDPAGCLATARNTNARATTWTPSRQPRDAASHGRIPQPGRAA